MSEPQTTKLISNSMHWGWKLSFVFAIFWLAVFEVDLIMHIGDEYEWYSIEVPYWFQTFLHDMGVLEVAGFFPRTGNAVVGFIPTTIWLAVRWLNLK